MTRVPETPFLNVHILSPRSPIRMAKPVDEIASLERT